MRHSSPEHWHWRQLAVNLAATSYRARISGRKRTARSLARLTLQAWRRAEARNARAAYLRNMTAEQKNAAQRIAAAIAKGVKDGIPVVSNVRAALRDPDVPKAPRLLASLATVAALVLAVYKFATGAVTLPELVQLIHAALGGH